MTIASRYALASLMDRTKRAGGTLTPKQLEQMRAQGVATPKISPPRKSSPVRFATRYKRGAKGTKSTIFTPRASVPLTVTKQTQTPSGNIATRIETPTETLKTVSTPDGEVKAAKVENKLIPYAIAAGIALIALRG